MSSVDFTRFVETLRERADIADVIGDYTSLARKGRGLRGPCPLHQGTNPMNFEVRPDRGFFKCYSDCGKKGDVFNFLMEAEGTDFMGACRLLAERYGIPMPTRQRPERSAEERERARLLAGQESAPEAWRHIGIDPEETRLRLGVRGSDLLLPVWSDADQNAPGGWLRYGVSGDEPILRGLEPTSRPGLAGSLVLPRMAVHAAAEDGVLLWVEDPLLLLLLEARGIRGAFSTVPDAGARASDSWIGGDALIRLGVRMKRPLRRVVLLSPGARTTPERMRRAHATEVQLLAQGIEPVLWDPPQAGPVGEGVPGWKWFREQPGSALEVAMGDPLQVRDLLELRLEHVERARAAGSLRDEAAIEKILPSLRAAHASGNALLYECALAWTLSTLSGTERAVIERRVKIAPGESEYEAF